jgi:carbon storage regulator CsrA
MGEPKTRLVLGMKAGERVHVGPDVEIEIDRISEFKIDVAIYAPKSVKILRQGLRDHTDGKGNFSIRSSGR